jgi:hypothetical protein
MPFRLRDEADATISPHPRRQLQCIGIILGTAAVTLRLDVNGLYVRGDLAAGTVRHGAEPMVSICRLMF